MEDRKEFGRNDAGTNTSSRYVETLRWVVRIGAHCDRAVAGAAGSIVYAVVNGVVDLSLSPTEDASLSDGPAVNYQAEYFLKNRGQYSEMWNVPRAAGGPYSISQLRGTA